MEQVKYENHKSYCNYKKLIYNFIYFIYQNKVIKQTKMPKLCSYCQSESHNISNCTVDNHLYETILYNSRVCPDFMKMSNKTLKKLASICQYKTSLPRAQLNILLSRVWEFNNKQYCELTNTAKVIESEECSICLDKIGTTNKCVTKCGHMFCLECMVIHCKKNNTCPLCREKVHNVQQPLPDYVSIEQLPDVLDNELRLDDLSVISNNINPNVTFRTPRTNSDHHFDTLFDVFNETNLIEQQSRIDTLIQELEVQEEIVDLFNSNNQTTRRINII